MLDILQGLNAQQRCAVISPAPVLQVLAPPGSGKTKTLTARVAYLIAHEGLKPWNIIVCTFTIKAAREMKERIRSFVGEDLEKKLVLGTFHSVARRYLAYYGQHIGIAQNFSIADSTDSLNIIKRIVKDNKLDFEPSRARSMISARKSKPQKGDSSSSKRGADELEFDGIFTEYEERLRISNLLDYDDLLLRCVDLLKRHPECVRNIGAVLIDEFQDTNTVQYELMTLFAQHQRPTSNGDKTTSITIVGDPDQSIYSFRAAEIKNLQTMRKQYADTHVVMLEENYRSSGSILLSATEVIEQDTAREVRRLLPTHCVGERPVLRTLSSAENEASWLVAEVQRVCKLSAGLLTYNDVAILLRSASLSRHIETALGKSGIPYRMIGGHKFFDRVEVKILLDYLRVISQPEHSDALCRIINLPTRGVGEKTVQELIKEAEAGRRTLWATVLGFAQATKTVKTKVSPSAERGLRGFVDIILGAQKKMNATNDEACTIFDLMGYVMKRLSYQNYLREKYAQDFESRWANVEELITQASDASVSPSLQGAESEEALFHIDGVEQRTLGGVEEILRQFLANVALSTAVEKSNEGQDVPLVTISTIHAAKGLEWPVVFIPAAYEGSIPHSRAEDNDEERRLLYVGMTRAQALLYLSWPKKSSNREATSISSFLTKGAVTKYFDTKGPRIGFTSVQDFARILRRSCPSETDIWAARKLVENPEDTKYPEDGEELVVEMTYYTHNSQQDDFNALRERLMTRRKMSRPGIPVGANLSIPRNTPFKPLSINRPGTASSRSFDSSFMTRTCTEDSSIESVPGSNVMRSVPATRLNVNSGFTSARFVSHVPALQVKDSSSQSVRFEGVTSRAGAKSTHKDGPAKSNKQRKLDGQSSLRSWFGAK